MRERKPSLRHRLPPRGSCRRSRLREGRGTPYVARARGYNLPSCFDFAGRAMKHAWFVTGTDTEVGKTFASCALLAAARAQGVRAIGMKPVASGLDADGCNEDVERLRAAAGTELPAEAVSTYRFAPAIAPHIAAREAGVAIRFAPILDAFARLQAQADVLVVEGVGGFRVPLGADGDSAALAVRLGLPVVIVVGLRLGCINHALLTAEAVAARGLRVAGWIGNHVDAQMARAQENIASLQETMPAPCLGILPHREDGDAAAAARAAGLRLPL